MKKVLLFTTMAFASFSASAQIFTEDFDGSNTTATTTVSQQCTDKAGDYFGILTVDDVDQTYTGASGNFFAAQDTDGSPCSSAVATASIAGIDVSGQGNLVVCFDIAEGDDGSNQDYDDSDYVKISALVDGSSVNSLNIHNDGSAFNSAPQIDCDGDGIGEGAEITSTFTQYCIEVANPSGQTLDIEIETALNSGDEDIAIDNIKVYKEIDAPVAPVCASISLPVELTAFSAKAINNTVALNWTTASEVDNDYFAVEVSTDGRNFKTIAEVNGNGTTNSVQNYNFVDKAPANGVNYYRLKQVDFDGAFEYSNIESVKMELAGISIRPTAAKNEITISLNGKANVEIFSITGQKVISTTVEDNQTIDVSKLNRGQYFVRVAANGTVSTERFVKL